MSKKEVCLYQWDYMINCNENENDNDKRDNTNKTYIDLDLDIETNIYSIACLGKAISLCNKQHLSNIWGSIYSKLSNTEAELKKALLIKKACDGFHKPLRLDVTDKSGVLLVYVRSYLPLRQLINIKYLRTSKLLSLK